MDDRGHVHIDDTMPDSGPGIVNQAGFVSRNPMPEICNARKVLSALSKIADRGDEVLPTDAALLPLTPFERGWVLGVLGEFRTWRERSHG